MNAKNILKVINKEIKLVDFVKRDEHDKSVFNGFVNYRDMNIIKYKIFSDGNIYYYDEDNDRFIFTENLDENKEIFIPSKVLKKDSILENIKSGYYEYSFYPRPSKPVEPDNDNIENDEDAEKFAEDYRQYKIDVKQYEEEYLRYKKNVEILMDEFHYDLKKEFHVENNHKEEILFNMSLEYFNNNFYKLYEHYKKYVELIK